MPPPEYILQYLTHLILLFIRNLLVMVSIIRTEVALKINILLLEVGTV